MRITNRVVALSSVVLMLLGGCGKGRGDSKERRVRCVSLVPSVTEIIYALNAEDLLLGNTNHCDFPPDARSKPKVGDFQSPDIERIMALKPDVVFATLPIHQRVIERLRELGVRVYVSAPRDLEGVFAEIESVGAILGFKKRAEGLVAEMGRRINALPVFSDTPRVYLEISFAPLMTVGAGVFINDLIHRAGGRNIFEQTPVPYPVVDPEMVVKGDPQVILLLHPAASVEEVKQRVGWAAISAVRDGRVYTGLDEDLFFRPGPRVVDGIYLLARLLHPENFPP